MPLARSPTRRFRSRSDRRASVDGLARASAAILILLLPVAGARARVLTGLHAKRPQWHFGVQHDDLSSVRSAWYAPVATWVVVVETDQQRELVHGSHGLDRL